MDSIHIHDDDFNFEENIINRPNDLKPWISYIASVQRRYLEQFNSQESETTETNRLNKNSVYVLYERALKSLPGSYKLWFRYLNLLTTNLSNLPPTHAIYEQVNKIFERSLYTMHKMPVIWRLYTRFLIKQQLVTKTRNTFDRALQSLPITQHEVWIWKPYIQWIEKEEVPAETGRRVYLRYLKSYPSEKNKYIDFLLSRGIFDEGCKLLTEELTSTTPSMDKSEIWNLLCETISKQPHDLRESPHFDVEKTLREGWAVYGDVGKGWICLAQYHASLGSFETCRDIFEEGLETVDSVRDFTTIFNAYSKFEEAIIEGMMMQKNKNKDKSSNKKKMIDEEEEEEEGEDSDSEEEEEDDDDDLFSTEEKIEFGMKRWENLMDRRPELLNLVKLRRNPHDVHEWLNRVRLYLPKEQSSPQEHSEKIVEIFTQALETIDPQQCTGRMVRIWIEFSQYYEEFHQDLGKARRVLEVGTQQGYPSVSDLTLLHSSRAELEMRHQNLEEARDYVRKILYDSIPHDLREFYKGGKWRTLPSQQKIFRSGQLWSFLVDLCVSFGELEEARTIYEDMIRLKVITIPQILNYAKLLEENRFFSAACRVYEKGIHLFSLSYSRNRKKKKNVITSSAATRNNNILTVHIWTRYLNLVLKRYDPKEDLEHMRSLFDRCIRQIISIGEQSSFSRNHIQEESKNILFGELIEEEKESEEESEEIEEEEESKKYGRIRNCLELLSKAVLKVGTKEKIGVYKVYLRTTSKYHPVSKIREIYDEAVQNLMRSEDLVDIVLEYIRLEVKLAEIDRARSLFENTSKYVGGDSSSSSFEESVLGNQEKENKKDLFFKEWEEFENRFGNLDTFKLMYKLREKYNKK